MLPAEPQSVPDVGVSVAEPDASQASSLRRANAVAAALHALQAAAVLLLRRGKGMVTDPADPDTRSAGSFFTNPVLTAGQFAAVQRAAAARAGRPVAVPWFPAGDGQVKVPAAWLIEQSGWKGHRRGPHGVHDRQALVLVNHGGAQGQDIRDLAYEIIASVREKFGIELHPEVNII